MPPYLLTQSASAPSTSTSTMHSGMPVRMFREKYHQCGRRSSASVSLSWIRLSGYPMASSLRQLGRHVALTHHGADASRPAHLAQSVVAHPEVVADLVQHGDAHTLREVGVVAREHRERTAEHRDVIGRDPSVADRSASRDRDPFVKAEKSVSGTRFLFPCRPLLHHHGNVLDGAGQLG